MIEGQSEMTHTTRDVHEEAVLRAEVHRLVKALSPYGALSRDVLRREAGALYWHEPLFDRALEAAIAQGRIAELPLGFYALRR